VIKLGEGYTPVLPATGKTEAGESLELNSQETKLSNLTRYLKTATKIVGQ
jgi:hypothetical protein